MTWFNLTSAFAARGEWPEMLCRSDSCLERSSHGWSRASDRTESLVNTTSMGCEHVPMIEHNGSYYAWAAQITRCTCDCDAYLVSRNAMWDETETDMRGAYDVDTGAPINLPDNTHLCSRCDQLEDTATTGARFSTTSRDVHRMFFCSRCAPCQFANCVTCDEEHPRGEMRTIRSRSRGNVMLCDSCENYWQQCAHCRYMWDPSEEEYCCNPSPDGNDSFYEDCGCSECRSVRNRRPRVIQNYSFKPEPDFRAIGPEVRIRSGRTERPADGTAYMGFELEVECDSRKMDTAALLQEELGDVAYLKEDGSIRNGFEIVTHPMTLEYAMERFNWKAIRKFRRDARIDTSSNCGLHVHVSKAAFDSPSHEYRWLLFWHRNQVAMRILADRDSSYAAYNLDHRSQFKDVVKGTAYGTERYSAINTQNPHTHEVRVFASTLYINRLQAALQLVDATVEYTRALASSKVMKDGGFSWHEFVMWLSERASRYGQLVVRIRDAVTPVLGNDEPVTEYTAEWPVRMNGSSYINHFSGRNITIQEKVKA